MPTKNWWEESKGNTAESSRPKQISSLSEEQFRLLVENASDVITILDGDGAIHYQSPSLERVLGYKPKDVVGKSIFEFIHPDDLPDFSRTLNNAIQDPGVTQPTETRFRHQDGSWRVLESVGRGLPKGPELSGVVVNSRDITERKRAEEALREQRARFQDLYENAPSAYFSVGTDSLIRRCNRRAGELLDCPTEELVGRPVFELYADTPQGKEKAAKVFQRFRAGERITDEELQMQKADGTPVWISLTVNAIRNADGQIVESRSMVVDITARKRAEEEREQLLTQIQQDRQQTKELARVLDRERHMLQTIMENTHAHLAYLDAQLNFVKVNSAYAQGSGYSKKELIGCNHFKLFPHAENQAIFEEVRETGKPVAFHAKPFVYPDRPELGVTYWDWTLTPVKDGDGRVEGLVLSLLDVTQRERSREALRRYAGRLQALHEIDQAIMATHSVEEIAEATLRHVRQLVPCLRASVAEFDFEADEMSLLAVHADGESRLGKGWRGSLEWAWFIEELGQGQAHVVEDLLALPPSSPLMEILQAGGVRSYVNVPIISEGKSIGSLNVGMGSPGALSSEQADIAREMADELAIGIHHTRLHQQVQRHANELEQRVAERTAELRASEARFRTLFNGAAIGIALVDMEGRLAEGNPALQETLGYSGEELQGMVFAEFTHPDDVMVDVDLFKELMAGKRDQYRVEKRYVQKNDQLSRTSCQLVLQTVVWANVTVSLVRGARGEPQYAISVVEDITEQKQAQVALIRAEKLAITGRLAASLAHEINNPLQSVIGCLGLAEESLAKGEDVGEFLQIGTEELERAARIVTQLRDLNRPSKPEERKPTDVNALLDQVLMLTRKQCQKCGIKVIREVTDDLPPLMLVLDRMQQVFLNLVLNAVEAMPEGGRLEVSTSHTGEPAGVRILFTDSGHGIAPDDLPHIFDPFYTTKPEGLGLGLYVTHSIVEDHGGRIEAQSRVGKGTTFEVWLPA